MRKENRTVFDTGKGKMFICHKKHLTVDELVEIGRELGVIKYD